MVYQNLHIARTSSVGQRGVGHGRIDDRCIKFGSWIIQNEIIVPLVYRLNAQLVFRLKNVPNTNIDTVCPYITGIPDCGTMCLIRLKFANKEEAIPEI